MARARTATTPPSVEEEVCPDGVRVHVPASSEVDCVMAGPTGNETNHSLDGLTVRGGLAIEGTAGIVTYLNRDVAATLARETAMRRAQGVYAETYPAGMTSAQSLMVTGNVYGFAVGLAAGDVVRSISSRCAVAGTTVSLAKHGLYSKTGALLASSASDGTAFESAGVKTLSMSTAYTVLTDDLYYLAIIAVSGVTMPTMFRINAFLGASPMGGVGSGVPPLVVDASEADLPAAATLIASSAEIGIWMGVA